MAGLMSSATDRRTRRQDSLVTEIAGLRDRIGQLEAEIHKLTTMRDRTAEVRTLEERIEKLKLEKDRLTEAHDREVRETEHRVGLLLEKQEQDVRNATREATLAVREENLARDRDRFAAEMTFQREAMQAQMNDLRGLLNQVMGKLPDIQATFSRKDAVTGKSHHVTTRTSRQE